MGLSKGLRGCPSYYYCYLLHRLDLPNQLVTSPFGQVYSLMVYVSLVGIFIVFDYCGQLREEEEAEWEKQSIASKNTTGSNASTVVVVPEVPMRTTYDANYDKSLQGGWTSARTPYAFTTAENANGNAGAHV